MTIDKLNSCTREKTITLSLTYEECRDIANALYMYSQVKTEDAARYDGIRAKMQFVFDMIKHGMIQQNTIESMYDAWSENRKKQAEALMRQEE